MAPEQKKASFERAGYLSSQCLQRTGCIGFTSLKCLLQLASPVWVRYFYNMVALDGVERERVKLRAPEGLNHACSAPVRNMTV
jgi:hypothetical protein